MGEDQTSAQPLPSHPSSDIDKPKEEKKEGSKISKTVIYVLVSLFIIAAGAFGFWAYQEKLVKKPLPSPKPASTPVASLTPIPESTVPADWKTYKNEEYGFEFRYPEDIITLNEELSKVTLTHSIPHKHPDPCDFKGIGVSLEELTDFRDSIEVSKEDLKGAVITNESDYFVSTYLLDDKLKIEPNFIEEFNFGYLKGYKIFMGAEGCGEYKYYISSDSENTLIIKRSLIAELNPITRNYNYQKYISLPGIITPDEEEKLFTQILSTFKFLDEGDLTKTVSSIPGEGEPKDLCGEGYIFSQKECQCLSDPFGCKGLGKVECEQNPNCFSFSRGGTCGCPQCEIYLSHQCLPKEKVSP